MKILLLGADGQVGFELHRSLAPLGDVVASTFSGRVPGGATCERADLADLEALAALVRKVAPAWIVNAAAYTAVDKAEDDYARAERINGAALGVLGAEAARLDAAVLHYSTDYVFAGDADRPYGEDHPTAPVNAYGRSKLVGEEALRASGAKHLILRTAWVYGARGHNFLLTMLRLAATRERLTVVDDQRGTPTSARLLADVSAQALRRLGGADAPWGTYHATASGETSWCGFARAIAQGAHAAGLIERVPVVAPIASRDYPTRAPRPVYSVLDCSKLLNAFGLHLPDWREGLAACLGERAEAVRPA